MERERCYIPRFTYGTFRGFAVGGMRPMEAGGVAGSPPNRPGAIYTHAHSYIHVRTRVGVTADAVTHDRIEKWEKIWHA